MSSLREARALARRARGAVVAVLVLALLALANPLAAVILAIGMGCAVLLVRRRSRSRLRATALLALGGVVLSGVLAALALPTYANRPSPLLVASQGTTAETRDRVVPNGVDYGRRGAHAHPTTDFQALGFVVSDDDGAAQAVDSNVASLSTLAATGLTLSGDGRSVVLSSPSDALQRAHINGAQGLITVSNYDGSTFDPVRAGKALDSEQGRQRLVSALSTVVAQGGWDGVVLDLEQLNPRARATYPLLVAKLQQTLGAGKQVVVAVPVYSDLTDPAAQAYDLHALGAAADQIVLMAYDDHETSSRPGPIAPLPWVKQAVTEATREVPAAKILLGVATYGYVWPARGQATDVTVTGATHLPGTRTWDADAHEWRLAMPDGGTAWYDDRRSVHDRSVLARQLHLGGVAIWRLGGGTPLSLGRQEAAYELGGEVHHYTEVSNLAGRPVERVRAAGLVALTFDDGPDPKWTPRILDELSKLDVPATFFDIGTEVQAHPELVRREIAEGDVVGDHTYSHKNLSNLPLWQAKAEVLGGAAVIEGVTGLWPRLFRSPYGAGELSDAGSSDKDALAQTLGMHAVNWTDDAEDWQKPDPRLMVDRVLAGVTPRTIILMHDGGGDRAHTLAALPMLVQELRARHYQFVTVDALDGSIASPYATRHDVGSIVRGTLIVSGFKLDMALRTLAIWLLVLLGAIALLRFGVALPLAFLHARRHRRLVRREAADAALPTVTIVVPGHNEEPVIARSIESILALDPAPDEVVVVDDGSTDRTAEIARRYPVTVISQEKSGKAAALNTGIAASTGEVVVVLDADTQLEPGFLRPMLARFADPAVGAVAGNVKVGNRRKLLPRLQALEYVVSLNLDRRAQDVMNTVSVVPGAAGAFRRSALDAVGGYPQETLVEDADLTMALLREGWRIPYEPRALAYTEAPESVADVVKQRRRWSFGSVEVAAKHRAMVTDPGVRPAARAALPWLFVSQTLVPLLGPLVEVYLLYLALVGNTGQALGMLGLAMGLDVVLCALAVALDREDWKLLLWVVPLRLLWRPLLLWAGIRAALSWASGEAGRWRRITRHNTVSLPTVPAAR